MDRIPLIAIFLVSLSAHEFAHAWVAYRCGDMTAARLGRLTFNPLAHISLVGTILMPLIIHFGWAKPVPVDFSALTRRQIAMVAAAGPATNLLIAVVLTAVFHLVAYRMAPAVGWFILWAILSNIILAVFNLIPIPPLDGSRIVFASLKSPKAVAAYRQFSPYALFIFIGFLYFGGFARIVLPVVALLYRLLSLPLP